MAEEHHQKSHEYDDASVVESGGEAEVKDRGLFDFLSKKEDQKHDQEVMAAEFEEKVQVSEVDYEAKVEEEKKEEKPSMLEQLRRSDSSSGSSSDEEEGEDGEKKKKKKGLKEKLKEKISGEEKEEKKQHEDTTVPVEKVEEEVHAPVYAEPPHHTPEPKPIYVAEPVHVAEPPLVQPEEKKGFLEKIKEKLPGGHKKPEDISASPPSTPAVVECPPPVVETTHHEEPKEKKGILDKIKEKLPGYHSKTEEEKGSATSD